MVADAALIGALLAVKRSARISNKKYRLPDKDKEIFSKIESVLKTFEWEKIEELLGL